MNVHGVYTIRDTVADQFGPVFTAANHGVASRQYRALMQEMRIVDYSEFHLVCVGQWDMDTGILTGQPSETINVVAPRQGELLLAEAD